MRSSAEEEARRHAGERNMRDVLYSICDCVCVRVFIHLPTHGSSKCVCYACS